MSLLTPRAPGPLQAKFVHESANVKFRLQAFLAIRDGQRRVAMVRLEDQPEKWRLPGEAVQLNEDPADAAARVAKMWFATPLSPRLVDIQSYPATGERDAEGEVDDRWYLILVYEVAAPGGLAGTPDTVELKFVDPRQAPGPTYADHASVLARLA